MNKDIFVSLCDRLEKEVPSLRWIDEDLGQLNVGNSTRPAVDFPCCLIDIGVFRLPGPDRPVPVGGFKDHTQISFPLPGGIIQQGTRKGKGKGVGPLCRHQRSTRLPARVDGG